MRRFCRVAALLLLPGAALGQDAVTVYGVVDVSLVYGKGSAASRTLLLPGGAEAPRIGVSGGEDLGGGYKASYTLELDILPDSGAGVRTNLGNQAVPNLVNMAGTQGVTLNRLLFVGLQAPWGRFRTGRDYTPTFAVQALYDPGGAGGLLGTQSTYGSISLNSVPSAVRASNSMAIAIGELRSGPLLHASYALGENPSDSGGTRKDGTYRGIRLAYTVSPIDVAVGYGVFKLASVGDIREWVLGGRFEFGKTTLWLQYLDDRTRLANQSHGGMVGLTYADGPWQYRATLSKSVQENIAGSKIGATTKAGAGTTYSFSRRTSLYANVAFTRNRHGATALPQGGIGQTAPDRGGHGREIGLRTSF